ncbi:MAG: DsbA family protein [Deltaproteobacteria bacterium]|nr:DsbA family protein [Deltaproteobacteria bacterium]
MIIAKRLVGKAISTWLGPTGDAARRAVATVKERISGGASQRTLDFYIDIADPWSYLTAQAVSRLIQAYPVELAVHIVTPPASDVDPAPVLRPGQAVRDAQQLAQYWDLEFKGTKSADPGMVRDVGTTLIRDRPAADQLRIAIDLLAALWAFDKKKLGTLLNEHGAESHGSIAPIVNANYAKLRKAGHYQAGMISYKGVWYWGIDRLPYLEAELARDLGTDVAHVVTPRPQSDRGPLSISDKPLTCELWFSFRSPYSYLALEQIETVLAPYKIPLVLRQIAPMVVRGLAVPQVKRMYIVKDAKREADRLGIAFGEICDPLGKGVDHCLAIQHWANKHRPDLAMAFARSAMRGSWAEARDLAEYVDLKVVVERAGLPWEEVRAALEDPEAVKVHTANAADLAVIGLWGVPSYRCGDFIAWGQDRLPLLADRLRRHALVIPPVSATP